jgi:hypothetical protein
MHALHVEILGFLTLVEIEDAAVGVAEGRPQIPRAGFPGCLELDGRHAQGVRPDAVEAFAELEEGSIAPQLDLLKDFVHPIGGFPALGSSGALGNGLEPMARGLPIVQPGDHQGRGRPHSGR